MCADVVLNIAFLALAFVSANGADDEVSFYAGIAGCIALEVM